MSEDLYEGFAGRYDLSIGGAGQVDPALAHFFSRLFTTSQVLTVLDCACGTGRHLPLFHQLGCQVWGSDVSQAMLAQARRNLFAAGLQIPLRQADFRELPGCFPASEPPGLFDAVSCLGAIGFMPDEQAVQQAFHSMRTVLRPGGLLVLSSIPTDRQWNEKQRFSLVANTPSFSRLFAVDYGERTARYNVLDVFHEAERDDLMVWSAELLVLLRDDLARLLNLAGFPELDFFGSFDFTPYDPATSHQMIAVAHAPG